MHDVVERALAEARALGFLGPGPLAAHEASAEAFLAALQAGPPVARCLDLGSGGGVPGLLLAAALPGTTWTLVDIHRRRTSFLARAVADPFWGGRVAVIRAPAEQLAHDPGHRAAYDAVVSRSFGPPAVTAECAVGFLRSDGRLLVAEPPTAEADRWSAGGLASLGLAAVSHEGEAIASFERAGLLPPEVPRSWRELERRPRW